MLNRYVVSFKVMRSDLSIHNRPFDVKVSATTKERAIVKAYEYVRRHNINIIDILSVKNRIERQC